MKNGVIKLPDKPLFMQECNGCGACCILELCETAAQLFGETVQGPCPALEYEQGRTWCGLIRHPLKHLGWPDAPEEIGVLFANGVKDILGVGFGCQMRDDLNREEKDSLTAKKTLLLIKHDANSTH